MVSRMKRAINILNKQNKQNQMSGMTKLLFYVTLGSVMRFSQYSVVLLISVLYNIEKY